MNCVKKVFALVLLMSVFCGCLASCGYDAEPIPDYEYPEVIYDYSSFSSSIQSGRIEDRDAIKSFIDMLNGCSFKQIVVEKEDFISETSQLTLNAFIIGEVEFTALAHVDFYIVPDLEYLILYDDYKYLVDDSVTTVNVYKIRDLDREIYDNLTDKKLEF